MTDQPDVQFGSPDCTCIPWTRQEDPPRYLNRPTDTVDMISGWERRRDCPHHGRRMMQPKNHVRPGDATVAADMCPRCKGDNTDAFALCETCTGPTPAPLRDRYAAAIASYDHAVGYATNPAPGDHHYGQADAVLAVRDRELEELRARVTELADAQATPHELELRQRRAWSAAGHCPMCNTDDTSGRLCDDCMTTVRHLPARERRGWRRYEPPATGTPIQSHGYTPAGLLGISDDQPPTA